MRGESVARQLMLLNLLEARGTNGLEIEEAVSVLGTRRRTVYRDFRVLEDIGVPLYSELDGKRARWRIEKEYRHRLQLGLTWSELLGLMVSQQHSAGLAGTPFHDGVASALEKIRATLPKGLADRFTASARLASAGGTGHDYRTRRELVADLVESIEAKKSVLVRYHSRTPARRKTAEKWRKLNPHHLRLEHEGLYLLAWCHRSRAMKTFRVERIDELQRTAEPFELVSDFDPKQFVAPMFGMWSGKVRRVSFVAGPEIAAIFLERKIHSSQVAQQRSDGSADIWLEVAIGPPLVAYLAGFGSAVSKISPPELNEAVLEVHRSAITVLGSKQ